MSLKLGAPFIGVSVYLYRTIQENTIGKDPVTKLFTVGVERREEIVEYNKNILKIPAQMVPKIFDITDRQKAEPDRIQFFWVNTLTLS